ncbi:MAG: hypothetical protein ACI9J3_004011, partial [Parvicellaceae bacterium]
GVKVAEKYFELIYIIYNIWKTTCQTDLERQVFFVFLCTTFKE